MVIGMYVKRKRRCQIIYGLNSNGPEVTVTVTADPFIVHHWIRSTYTIHNQNLTVGSTARLVVGLGVRWTIPVDGDTPAETLQLCVGDRCLVFQLSHAPDVPATLRQFLMDRKNIFVGFWNKVHLHKLEISRHHLILHMFPLDLTFFAAARDGRSLRFAPIEEIAGECLGIYGIQMLRHVTVSNWNVRSLQFEQVMQVALVAYCSFKFGFMLQFYGFII